MQSWCKKCFSQRKNYLATTIIVADTTSVFLQQKFLSLAKLVFFAITIIVAGKNT
jgi:hypothetical protein